MRPTRLTREFFYTASHGTTLIAFIAFFLLIEFALFGRLYGLFLLAILLPALLRYLMLLLDARARGVDPGPPGAELLLWYDNIWSLFPVLHVLILVYASYLPGGVFPGGVAYGFLMFYALLLPASLAVLAISRTPLESLRPRAITALIRYCLPDYWIVPAYILGSLALLYALGKLQLTDFFLELVALYLLFAGFAILGGIIRPYRLHEQVSIPEPLAPATDVVEAKLEQRRVGVLEHAYGSSSRGNMAAGLAQVYQWLDQDPDPQTAWPWFLEQMLDWESSAPALSYAQRYLGVLLARGEHVAALKLIQRCRLTDPTFRPLPEDQQLALQAAERCQHDELKSLLL